MSILIRGRQIEQDRWTFLQAASGPDVFAALRDRDVILPLPLILHDEEEARTQLGRLGVWLDSHESIDTLSERVHDFPLIALNFPSFSDGRAYTSARLLRADLGYKGEIRAIGDVMRDQLAYMANCGFDAFQLRDDQLATECLAAFDDFSTTYAATAVEPSPLFRRR